jgi:excinuclease UvrABC ATPase subunit
MGFQWDFAPELIFTDPRKSVRDALTAIADSFSANAAHLQRAVQRLLQELASHIDPDKSFGRLAKKTREEILHGGSGRAAFGGVIPYIRELWKDGADEANSELSALLNESPCGACQGRRLNSRAQGVRVAG